VRTHNHNGPITHLAMPERRIPVLIDARPNEAEGFVPSIIWSDKPMTNVRRLLPSLIEGLSNRRRQRELEKENGAIDPIEWDRIRELLALKDRLNAGDWSPVFTPNLDESLNPLAALLDRASPGGWFMEKDDPEKRTYRSGSGDVRATISFKIEIETPSATATPVRKSRPVAALSSDPGSIHAEKSPEWSGRISGDVKSAIFAFSEAFTAGLSKTRFVVWWHNAARKFVPGLYCPDFVTALYALAMWSTGTAGGWAICRRCHKDFARKRAKQLYCTSRCQAAAAMSRLRHKRKEARAAAGL